MASDRRIAGVITGAAAVLAALACVVPPAIYFGLSYEGEAAALEVEAEVTAQVIDRVVTANPDLWRYEAERLSDTLTRRPRSGDRERRRVRAIDGAVVAESADPLVPPLVVRAFPLRDAGVRVGEVEIARSLQPIVFHTALLVLLLAPVSFLAFQVLRTVPLRAVRESQRELRRQRDSARRYLDVAAVAVVLLDERGRVAFANHKAAEVLGRPARDLAGKLNSGKIRG